MRLGLGHGAFLVQRALLEIQARRIRMGTDQPESRRQGQFSLPGREQRLAPGYPKNSLPLEIAGQAFHESGRP